MNTGIICEFNPFHNGHKHLIDTLKSENSKIICVMSGNFVQRGEFAVFDKWERTRSAIANGADLVIEIPTVWSTLSAGGFAKAGVGLIEATGIADRLAFGAECDDINALKDVANRLPALERQIIEEMKKGVSFPAARKAVAGSDILDSPNNILAIEYLKATTLPCTAVKRIGEGHDTDDGMYSAAAIRKTLHIDSIYSMKHCQRAILAKLRTMSPEDFAKINDVSEGLENRIYDAVRSSISVDEIYAAIKTKRYTHSRIRRIILRAFLGITKNDVCELPYIRVLGFNENGKEMLSQMKKRATLPIVTRYADISGLSENAVKTFETECRCTDLYNLGYKTPLPCGTEQRSQIVLM